MRVVAGRDAEQVRAPLPRDRRDHVLDERQELVGPAAGRDRQVDRVALSVAAAEVRGRAGPGIQRALVDARVEDLRGAVEDRLGAVAVVDVPVEDQDPLGAALGDRVGRSDGDVVEQAEAHRPVALGVVARRPQAAEGEAALGQQSFGGVHGSAGRVRRGLPGARTGDRVEVDHPAALRREASIESTWAALWTRSSCSRVAAGASTSSSPSQSRSDIASSIAVRRLAFSGWPPVSCWKELGCRR